MTTPESTVPAVGAGELLKTYNEIFTYLTDFSNFRDYQKRPEGESSDRFEYRRQEYMSQTADPREEEWLASNASLYEPMAEARAMRLEVREFITEAAEAATVELSEW